MSTLWTPVTPENCIHVSGPFYHGTKASLAVGDLITTGHISHFEGRALKHVYFSALLEPAIWGAELAMAMTGMEGRGQIYVVQPTGPFEDDPNLTNKRFPGNPTRSYRTTDPLRIIDIVLDWQGHPAEVVNAMLASLADLKRNGRAFVEE
jgi:rifampin ADP-ribosylating transferase